jgi:DNA-binding HxlR family transcriptional regulator
MSPGCCPFQTAFDLLSKRHAMTIIWLLQERSPRRFTEIKVELAVNPVTLTQRLTDLEKSGVLQRTVFNETPPRVEYHLTLKGVDLLPLIKQACEWADRWDAQPVRA